MRRIGRYILNGLAALSLALVALLPATQAHAEPPKNQSFMQRYYDYRDAESFGFTSEAQSALEPDHIPFVQSSSKWQVWILSGAKEVRTLDANLVGDIFCVVDHATFHATRVNIVANLFSCARGGQALFEQSTIFGMYVEVPGDAVIYMHGGCLSAKPVVNGGLIDLRNVALDAPLANAEVGGEILLFGCSGRIEHLSASGTARYPGIVRVKGGSVNFSTVTTSFGGLVECRDAWLHDIIAAPVGGEIDLRRSHVDRVTFSPRGAATLRLSSRGWLAVRGPAEDCIIGADGAGAGFGVSLRGSVGNIIFDDGAHEQSFPPSSVLGLRRLNSEQVPPATARSRQLRVFAAALFVPIGGCLGAAVMLKIRGHHAGVFKLLSLGLCIAFALLWHRTASTEDWWYHVGRGERLTELYSAGGAIRFWSAAHFAIAPDSRWTYGTRDRQRTMTLVPAAHLGGAPRGVGSAAAPIVIPYWLCCTLTAISPLLGVCGSARRSLRRRQHRCVGCGYSLHTHVGRCPECGTVPGDATKSNAVACTSA